MYHERGVEGIGNDGVDPRADADTDQRSRNARVAPENGLSCFVHEIAFCEQMLT